MTVYTALILVCLRTLALQDCTEASADQVLEIANTLSAGECLAAATDFYSIQAMPYRMDARHYAVPFCRNGPPIWYPYPPGAVPGR